MKNIKQDALDIINGAIKCVLPEEAVKEALKRDDFISKTKKGRVIVAAIGKAAWRMAKAADAGGGIIDGKTQEALKKVDALLITGPTGTNVNDVVIALMI